MSLNKVMLIGNIGKDPEIRYIGQDKTDASAKVATMPLATSESYKDKNGERKTNTEWHNVVAYRASADIIEKYVKKGSQVYVEGKLRTRQWNDQAGNKKYTTEVVVESIQLLDRKPQDEQRPQQQAQPQAQAQPAYAPQPQAQAQPQAWQPATVFDPQDDDLPF